MPFLILLSIAVLISCSEEFTNESDFVAGSTFTDSNIRVLFIDTLSVPTSTMKFDSIITSLSPTRILVGQYTDPEFGTVRASSFFEMSPSEYTIDTDAVYDSISLYLDYDTYYYNDTLQPVNLNIKRLSNRVKAPVGDNLYNTSTISYPEENLAQLNYLPRPTDSDTLEIRLRDEFGLQVFDKLQQKEITNIAEFKEFFNGFTVQPGENDDGAVIGFSLSEGSYMRLYFSISEADEIVQSYLDLSIDLSSSPVPFFNQIVADEPNDYLETLEDKEINLYSSESENKSFVQSGIGIATRIEFPNIKSLYEIEGEGTILDAVLKIKPTNGSYNDNLMLRDTLDVYIVDQNNDITQQLIFGGTSSVQAILNRDDQEFNNIFYEIPLTSYLDDLLITEQNTEGALILLPENYNTTVDRFVLNGDDSSDFNTTLELTYSVYD